MFRTNPHISAIALQTRFETSGDPTIDNINNHITPSFVATVAAAVVTVAAVMIETVVQTQKDFAEVVDILVASVESVAVAVLVLALAGMRESVPTAAAAVAQAVVTVVGLGLVAAEQRFDIDSYPPLVVVEVAVTVVVIVALVLCILPPRFPTPWN